MSRRSAQSEAARWLRLLPVALIALPGLGAGEFPVAVAHRGGKAARPENTLPGYDHSLDAGVEWLEIDVWLSSDGVPVCHHDATLNRTTNGTGLVYEKTLAELKLLDAGSWFGPVWAGTEIPTLEEAALLIKGRGKIVFDIKQPDYSPAIVQVLEDTGFPPEDVVVWDRVGAATSFLELMPGASRISPILPQIDWEDRIYQRALAGDLGVTVGYLGADKAYVDLVHSYGLLAMTHVVASAHYERMVGVGTDIIVAHNASTLLGALPTAAAECSNGLDDDGDGDFDYPDDSGCFGPEDRAEDAACSDGLDNDGDGDFDHPDDAGCFASYSQIEDPACSDGVDNNQDGEIDFPDDPGCFAAFDRGEQASCADGLDNDGDGLVDFPEDPGCWNVSSETENPECDDQLDNDGDGLIDGDDTHCFETYDYSERGNFPACDDGVDGDGDGLMDYPEDPQCTSLGDVSELPQCSDGVDNDLDGFTDFGSDPECLSAESLSEGLPDSDDDTIVDPLDNCLNKPNPTQLDTNGDGFGNACDADYSDDGLVSAPDFIDLAAGFGRITGQPGYSEDLDANGDGAIGAAEFVLLSGSYGGPPGPSGLPCAGTVPCP